MIAFLDLIDDYKDKERFKKLYNKYRGLMAHIASTKTSSHEDIEDILQEAFFYIAKNFNKVGNIDSPKTKCFVSVITEGFAISRYRKEKKYNNTISATDVIETDIPYNDFDIYSKVDLELVIDTLSDEYRNLIYLTYIFGYKSKEIAGIYGLTDSNVRKKIQFAKAEIRNKLESRDKNE